MSTQSARHGWSADLCDLLETVEQGRAAAELTRMPISAWDGYSQVTFRLPMWGWTTADIDLGRKAVGPAGTTLTFPLRITWSHPLVGVGQVGEELTWSASGMGHDLCGTVRLGGEDRPLADLDVSIRSEVTASAGPSQLAHPLVDKGVAARWEVIQMLEPMIAREVTKAHAAVAGELGVSRVLDEISLASVTDELVLGTEHRTSAVARFIDKALTKPEVFAKVDPLRAARIEFYRCARQAILLAIGDPREGRKIRALADVFRRADGSIDIDSLLAAYRAKHPADRMGRDRAVAALTTGADLMAQAVRDPATLDLVVAA